jgi:hypothetical protein
MYFTLDDYFGEYPSVFSKINFKYHHCANISPTIPKTIKEMETNCQILKLCLKTRNHNL